ncbi:hypothetical protein [Mesorhizobium sp. M2A.F.Ca.ET.039.01.1.1]|uniref:hypothetical protein n=1 Tax=Mesorhizobium sp. M2A.F.Ca.ET.039.01.1.1 TaxID=2496746 RepID=UPI000FCA018A|nr:hypothetical protein [Mesorhizobium sp. M2A.F.Ca.ET.039.01.1.1]RWX72602.1 hypothetical protein EOA24_00010 [Mesorhizobium sp. M2A.F.Ca.ET.039.01.1.1]
MSVMPYAAPAQRGRTLKQLVKDAGLLANLKMCHDAGARSSWSGSGNWKDISGNGYDFVLAGTTVTPFSGTVGACSDNECFVGNLSGYFEQVNGVDAFTNSWHQQGGNGVTWVSIESYATSYGVGWATHTGSTTGTPPTGVLHFTGGSGGFPAQWEVGNGSQSRRLFTGGSNPNNSKKLIGKGHQFVSPTSKPWVGYDNGTFTSGTDTGSFTPSAGAASMAKMRFGALSDGTGQLGTNRKVFALAVFDKILSQAEFDALRTQFLKRWTGI